MLIPASSDLFTLFFHSRITHLLLKMRKQTRFIDRALISSLLPVFLSVCVRIRLQTEPEAPLLLTSLYRNHLQITCTASNSSAMPLCSLHPSRFCTASHRSVPVQSLYNKTEYHKCEAVFAKNHLFP